jgi:hypothetical protein
MKKFLLSVCVFVLAICSSGHAQSKLSICAGVNEEGNCFLTNSKYITSPGKEDGLFFMMVSNQQGLNTSAIDFKVYTVNKTGEETLAKSMRQEVGADWVFAWKSEMFVSPGKYSVVIFDNNGNQLDKKLFELVKFQ